MLCSAFTIEVCARMDRAPGLQAGLRALMSNLPETEWRAAAWQRQAAAADLLFGNMQAIERGCWEFWPEPVAATETYADWARPVTDRVVPAASSRNPYDNTPHYLTFTMAYLLLAGSPSEKGMRSTCDVSESDLWTRAHFTNVLAALKSISFASVRRYAFYLSPRDDDRGFAPQDLASEKFRYLRFLTPAI